MPWLNGVLNAAFLLLMEAIERPKKKGKERNSSIVRMFHSSEYLEDTRRLEAYQIDLQIGGNIHMVMLGMHDTSGHKEYLVFKNLGSVN